MISKKVPATEQKPSSFFSYRFFVSLTGLSLLVLAFTLHHPGTRRFLSLDSDTELSRHCHMSGINAQELQALGQEYSSLRTVVGHWKGGEFNTDVDAFKGKKHETMNKLHTMLGKPGTPASLVIQAMGKPDEVSPTLPGIHAASGGAGAPLMPGPVVHGAEGPAPGAFASGGSTYFLVYEWRAKHDYLWFEVDSTTEKVIKSDWYMALE